MQNEREKLRTQRLPDRISVPESKIKWALSELAERLQIVGEARQVLYQIITKIVIESQKAIIYIDRISLC